LIVHAQSPASGHTDLLRADWLQTLRQTGSHSSEHGDSIGTVHTGVCELQLTNQWRIQVKKGKGSPYSITERRVPELIPVLDSQPAGGVSLNPGGRLPLLSARPAVTPATLKRAATNFAAW